MTTKEAIKLLDETPFRTSDKPARINKGMTCAKSIELVRSWIAEYPSEKILDEIFEKRVLQVTLNRIKVEIGAKQ